MMLALGADHVVLREGVVLNPHYQTMGLFGSEYWTYVLPRPGRTHGCGRLTDHACPSARRMLSVIGLADKAITGRRDEFESPSWTTPLASLETVRGFWPRSRTLDARRRAAASH